MLLLHRVVHEVDMRVYSELLPWRKSEVKEIIGSLETGNCIFMNGETVRPIYVRERTTFHAGFTPSLEAVATPELKQVSASIIEAIERAREGRGRRTRTQELEEQLTRLQEKLTQKEEKIDELEETARTLGYIKVEVPHSPPPAVVRRESTPQEAVSSEFVAHLMGTTRCDSALEKSTARERVASETGWGVIEVAPAAPASTSSALPPAVRRHIDRLVARVERRSLVERRVLAFLFEHAPGSYTASQIAAWIHCAREMIEDELPRELLEAGLIARERRTDGLRFQSRLKTYVSGEFAVYLPDIGESGIHAVTRQLSDRLIDVP
jgi:hypothetical protein